jgi:hypothetical protein
MPESPRCTIIREHEFDEQLHALILDLEEADEFTAGAEDLLARHPQSGMPASHDRSVWYLPMSPVRDRRVSLFYTFDETFVIFLAILSFDD